MSGAFIGRDIEVTTGGDIREPVSFTLDGTEHAVVEVLESWPDYGFGNAPRKRTHWWQRHHRNYYRVKTTQGEIFEIYYDRGTSLAHPERKKWFLTRQL